MTTEAALKAWDTRRRNGWVHPNARDEEKPASKTRAKQARAAMLSERALKAWDTRRANEAAAEAAAKLRAKKRRRGW